MLARGRLCRRSLTIKYSLAVFKPFRGMCKNMEKVQISAILNSVDKTSSVSIMFDITDSISFGMCSDSIVFTSSNRELTNKYTRLVLTNYKIFGGNPVLVCTHDTSIEKFDIYQTTITVK